MPPTAFLCDAFLYGGPPPRGPLFPTRRVPWPLFPPATHPLCEAKKKKKSAVAGRGETPPTTRRLGTLVVPVTAACPPWVGALLATKEWSRPWTGTSWRPSWRSSCGASRYNRLSVSPGPAIMLACLAGSTRRSCARMSSLRATCAGLPLSCSRRMTRRRGRANARASSLPKRRTRSWRPSKSTRLRHRRWRRCETRSRQQRGAANAPQHRHAPPPHPYQPWLPPNPSSLLVLTRCLANLNLSF